jgi:hypothetical protein
VFCYTGTHESGRLRVRVLAEVSVQMFGSRVLLPLTKVGVWLLPVVLAFCFGREILTTTRTRRGASREPQQRRDGRFMLMGAAVGAVAAYVPVSTWLYVRFAMLIVLPILGATVGLALSGLLPAVVTRPVRVAELEPRTASGYVPRRMQRWTLATTGAVGFVTAVRLILPEERPLSDATLAQLGHPVLPPTRMLYLGAFAVAVATLVLAWAATSAQVRRARTAHDSEELRHQDATRRQGVLKLLRWTTATMLLFTAALLTPLPGMMGGVVFGDVQLIQRTADLVTVVLIAVAAWIVLAPGRRDQLAGSDVA